MTAFTLTTPNRRDISGRTFSVLRAWLRSHAAQVALDRLDDRMRRDIGLPTRGDRPLHRHEAAARIAMMNLR